MEERIAGTTCVCLSANCVELHLGGDSWSGAVDNQQWKRWSQAAQTESDEKALICPSLGVPAFFPAAIALAQSSDDG